LTLHRSLLDFLINDEIFSSFLSVHSLDRIGTARPLQLLRQQLQLPNSQIEQEVGPGHFSVLYVIYGLNVSLLFSHSTIHKQENWPAQTTNIPTF
jgi:hypothetical protein